LRTLTNDNIAVDEMDKITAVQKLLKEKAMKSLHQNKITEYVNAH